MAKAEANVAASINAHISYKIHSTQVLAGAGRSLSSAPALWGKLRLFCICSVAAPQHDDLIPANQNRKIGTITLT
ncbi:hypothetical protein [Aureimonas sp. N4]|uniref:hypothetical protein n=1 Tax=Aureimonas sp. N4 TaxID=1638165 RepID=UPI0012E37C0F|nr:hypothetical protein [Aureimonas sp. N4]